MPEASLVARNEIGKGLVPTELPFFSGEIDNTERNKKKIVSYQCWEVGRK